MSPKEIADWLRAYARDYVGTIDAHERMISAADLIETLRERAERAEGYAQPCHDEAARLRRELATAYDRAIDICLSHKSAEQAAIDIRAIKLSE